MSQREKIAGEIAPRSLSLFMEKSADYGDDNANVLGPKGQFADIWRKIGKLKRALWEEQQLTGEQPVEILHDLVGHCWLAIAMLEADDG